MKKTIFALLSILIFSLTLTGCGESQEITPFLEQETVIVAPSENQANKNQGLSEKKKVIDEKILLQSAEYINQFSGLSPFSDISLIDKSWIVSQLKYHGNLTFYDSALYEKYRFDMFTKLEDLETLAKQRINPSITMTDKDDFSSCDGSQRFIPMWIEEEQVFGWVSSGGLSDIFQAYPIETYEVDGEYHVKAIDLYLSYEQEYFVDTLPTGVIYAIPSDSTNSDQYVEIGTFTEMLDENYLSAGYDYTITEDINALMQYWYVIEPNSDGFFLNAKQPANSTPSVKANVSIDGNPVALVSPPVFEDDRLLIPFYEFNAEYSRITNENIYNNNYSMSKINHNEYCNIEPVLFDINARMIYDESSNTYHIFSAARINQNAEEVGSYLMNLVKEKKATVLYKPTIEINGAEKQFKVVSLLGDGYLDIIDGKPAIVDATTRPDSLKNSLVSEAENKNFDTSKYVFGYFLDDENHIVTDPVALSQLQTITIANWEYEIFRDGLTLMDDYMLFWEKPKHFTGSALLEKWNACIKTAYDAIEFNQGAEPYLDFMESFAATVAKQTFSPQTGIASFVEKTISDVVKGTLIGLAVDAGMNNLTGKVMPSDIVYSTTITEHDIFLSQRDQMKDIVEKTGDKYILTFDDACVFLQGYYQLNSTMKTLYTSCEVYKELIPESRKSIEGALVNLGKNILQDVALDYAVVKNFNDYIDSEEVCSIISNIASGVIDNVADYENDPVNNFLTVMYIDIKNEKMKLNTALYNNVEDSMSYAVVSY